MNILMVGPQGSGKGTQAERLIEKFGLVHVEMGGLLRQISKEDSDLGLKVKETINSGQLVPDEMIIEILNNYLESINQLDNLLFDGFPRVISQARYFDEFMTEKGKKLDIVISLTLSKEEVFQRLGNRRTCSKCGKVFNVATKPSKIEGVCDYCEGELIVRAYETLEKIEKRLNAFEQQTVPMIEHYQKQGIVEEVDGERPIEVIFEDIVERLKKRGLIANV